MFNFDYDRELPTITHNFVSDILADINALDLAITDYILSVGFELPKDEEKDLKNIANLSANLTNKYSYGSTPVLKGRITNNQYIWHTNPNACQKCQDLDNTVYSNKSDVPDKPHPNCKCSVEEMNIFDKGDKAVASIENVKISENTTPASQENSGNNNNYEKKTLEDVYQYIQENNKAPHWHITQNIYWDEVVKYPSLNYEKPTIEVLINLYKTAVKIQEFIDIYYPGSKIQINSGWRSKGYNDTLGNAHPNSEHLYGNAIDFKIIGQNINSVYAKIKQYWKGRHYVHTTYGFIHVDRTREHGIDLIW